MLWRWNLLRCSIDLIKTFAEKYIRPSKNKNANCELISTNCVDNSLASKLYHINILNIEVRECFMNLGCYTYVPSFNSCTQINFRIRFAELVHQYLTELQTDRAVGRSENWGGGGGGGSYVVGIICPCVGLKRVNKSAKILGPRAPTVQSWRRNTYPKG